MAVAGVYSRQGKNPLAREHTEHATRIYLRVGLEQEPEVAEAYTSMGLLYTALRYGLAPTLEYHRKALRIYSRALGEGDVNVAEEHSKIGGVYAIHEQYEQAEQHCLAAYTGYKNHYGDSHEKTAQACADYARALKDQGKTQAALGHFAKTHSVRRRVFGCEHLSVGHAAHNIAGLHLRELNLVAAIEYYREAQAVYCAQLGRHHALTVDASARFDVVFATRMEELMLSSDEPAVTSVLKQQLTPWLLQPMR